MFTTAYFEQKFARVFNNKQAKRLAEAMVEAYDDLVKTRDFNELKSIVRELATVQQRTEQRVAALAVAQERTEQRMEELAYAQQRTEQRMEKLADAQERTEQCVAELAVAQQRTEQRVDKLAYEQKETRKQVGGLATAIGCTLEDKAYKALPHLLKRDFGLIVQGQLKRAYITDNKGHELEVNITGQALQNGKTVTIIGESKSQLSKPKIDSFIRKRLQRFEGVVPDCFSVLVTYMMSSSDVEEYAKTQGIAVCYSYDF